MQFNDIFMLTSSPVLSGFAWFFIFTIVLYVARIHAHKAIQSVSRVVHNGMRLSARAVMRTEKRMICRNKY